jgi:hypothetical protein
MRTSSANPTVSRTTVADRSGDLINSIGRPAVTPTMEREHWDRPDD